MKYCLMGMPNVGKSSIFNRLCNKNLSIIHDKDHTTIDYLSYTVGNDILIDTNGFNGIKDFNSHVGKVILNVDVVLYVVNGTVGLINKDMEIIKFLRKNNKKIFCLVNFSDKSNLISITGGFEKIYYVSAMKPIELDFLQGTATINSNKTIIGLIGKSNVGKSSLMNCLVSKYRSIVKDQLHTTRDSVMEEKDDFCYIDTAGYKNSNHFMDTVISKKRDRSLQYATGLVSVIDYSQPVTALDKQCIYYAYTHNIFTIICFNKCDLNKTDHYSIKHLDIPSWIPVVYVSATKNKVQPIINAVKKCLSVNENINTKLLNQLLKDNKDKLVMKDKSQCTIKYLTQTHSRPIQVSYFSSKEISEHSKKYLIKIIAEKFNLFGRRVKLLWKKKDNIYL